MEFNIEGLGVGLGGVGAGVGISYYVLRRAVGKVLSHIENNNIHVDDRNGYVRATECGIKYAQILAMLNDIKQDIRELRNEIKNGK